MYVERDSYKVNITYWLNLHISTVGVNVVQNKTNIKVLHAPFLVGIVNSEQ